MCIRKSEIQNPEAINLWEYSEYIVEETEKEGYALPISLWYFLSLQVFPIGYDSLEFDENNDENNDDEDDFDEDLDTFIMAKEKFLEYIKIVIDTSDFTGELLSYDDFKKGNR